MDQGFGVEEISDKGMSSVIRASLQRAMEQSGDLRIVGGYDSLKDEYLFTIVNLMRKPDNVGEPVVQQIRCCHLRRLSR